MVLQAEHNRLHPSRIGSEASEAIESNLTVDIRLLKLEVLPKFPKSSRIGEVMI